MPGFDSVGPLNYLKAMVAAVAGTQDTFLGIPAARDAKVTVSLTVGGMPTVDHGTRQLIRHGRYLIEYTYRLDDDEGAAELGLAAFVDGFTAAWKADRTLGGTCASCILDFAGADRPEYRLDAAQENRTYPIIAICTQYDTFPLPQ